MLNNKELENMSDEVTGIMNLIKRKPFFDKVCYKSYIDIPLSNAEISSVKT